MSKAATDWARKLSISNPPMKAVLRALAYMHSDKHELFPSQQYLATETGMSERSVRYALQLLSHFRLITRTPCSTGAGGRTSDRFELHFDRTDPVTRDMVLVAKKGLRKSSSKRQGLPVATNNSQPAQFAGPPGTVCRGIGDEQSPIHTENTTDVEVSTRRPALRVMDGGRP